MLTYKRYKQLRKRRIQLNQACFRVKISIKYKQRFKDTTQPNYESFYTNYKRELNLINDTLRLHKILYKQHLVNQEFLRNI